MPFYPSVAYHQLYVAPAEEWPQYDPTSVEPLVQVTADARSLIIKTGVAMGPIELDVALVPSPQSVTTPSQWQDSADGELEITEPLYVLAPTVATSIDDPVFTPPQAGRYGFRLHATGRDTHYDEVVDDPVETYRLSLWPLDPRDV